MTIRRNPRRGRQDEVGGGPALRIRLSVNLWGGVAILVALLLVATVLFVPGDEAFNRLRELLVLIT